jgi:pimeloyl-ACP methyl ester carboxylesterase
MGGTVLTNVALMHPRLFATLVIFEPMFFKYPKNSTSLGAYAITFRKDKWPSREVATKSLTKHPLYKHWDRDVLKIFLDYGLRDLPTVVHSEPLPSDAPVPVTLTTTKHQEASNYARAAFPPNRSTPYSELKPSTSHPDLGDTSWRHPDEPFYRAEMAMTYRQLPHLRPSCLILYGAETTFVKEQQIRDDRTEVMGVGVGGSGGVAKGRVKELEVAGGGHFFPFENPRKLAQETVGPWFDQEMKRWTVELEAERKAWEAVEPAQRSQLSDDWRHWMKTHNDPRKVNRSTRVKL